MHRQAISSVLGFCVPAVALIVVTVLAFRPLVSRAWLWVLDMVVTVTAVLIVAKIVNTVSGRSSGR